MVSRNLMILCCLVVAVVAKPTYTDKYDNIDLEEFKENKRLLLAYVDCILDKGKCTAEGKALKDNLLDATETGCEKCTEKQKEGSYEMIEHLIKNEPEIWNELCAKYDPTGKWRKEYEEKAKAKGIKIPQKISTK
uniref:Chemosensory protein n=1 Tax=Papilio xuthus TaxID=66420 RepID=A8QWQ9_PAPXU|nr:ejaculatory bulb-specific protein 3-like precursor [Papilio xuthus]BAF91719.1 chemosensory protein [Papilio xuthus]